MPQVFLGMASEDNTAMVRRFLQSLSEQRKFPEELWPTMMRGWSSRKRQIAMLRTQGIPVVYMTTPGAFSVEKVFGPSDSLAGLTKEQFKARVTAMIQDKMADQDKMQRTRSATASPSGTAFQTAAGMPVPSAEPVPPVPGPDGTTVMEPLQADATVRMPTQVGSSVHSIGNQQMTNFVGISRYLTLATSFLRAL